jgi:hypothetical protein
VHKALASSTQTFDRDLFAQAQARFERPHVDGCFLRFKARGTQTRTAFGIERRSLVMNRAFELELANPAAEEVSPSFVLKRHVSFDLNGKNTPRERYELPRSIDRSLVFDPRAFGRTPSI